MSAARLLVVGVAFACALACSGRDPVVADDGREGEGEGEGEGEEDRFAPIRAAVESDLEKNLATGAQVAVWLDDEIVAIGNFGTRDPTNGDLVTDATQFCIGSDTKKLTATAALRAVAAGDIALTDTVADVLPDLELPNAAPFLGATLHDLISHQGGGLDWYDIDTETQDEDGELRTTTYGDFAAAFYSMAPPGVFYNYSNPNFSIAGLLTETRAGAPYADLLEDGIFTALGMDDTVARKSEVTQGAGGTGASMTSSLALGRGFDEMWETGFVRPAGMVWSTASDQIRVARYLVDGDTDVLSDELRERISTPQAPAYPDLDYGSYGYGLFIGRGITMPDGFHDVPVWSHGGNTLAHTSTFYVLPEQRFAISILSNGQGDDFTDTVVAATQALVTLPAVITPDAPPMPTTDDLLALEGEYDDPFNTGDIHITSNGTGLDISMPLVDAAGLPYDPQMTPLAPRVYLWTLQGFQTVVTFWDGPDGSTYFATRYFVGARAPGGGGAAAPGGMAGARTPNVARLRDAIARAPRVSERALAVFGPNALIAR